MVLFVPILVVEARIFTNPQTAIITNRAIIPQSIYVLPDRIFSSSPPAVMYWITPQRKITVASTIKNGMMAPRIPLNVVIKSLTVTAAAKNGEDINVIIAVSLTNLIFVFIFNLFNLRPLPVKTGLF